MRRRREGGRGNKEDQDEEDGVSATGCRLRGAGIGSGSTVDTCSYVSLVHAFRGHYFLAPLCLAVTCLTLVLPEEWLLFPGDAFWRVSVFYSWWFDSGYMLRQFAEALGCARRHHWQWHLHGWFYWCFCTSRCVSFLPVVRSKMLGIMAGIYQRDSCLAWCLWFTALTCGPSAVAVRCWSSTFLSRFRGRFPWSLRPLRFPSCTWTRWSIPFLQVVHFFLVVMQRLVPWSRWSDHRDAPVASHSDRCSCSQVCVLARVLLCV